MPPDERHERLRVALDTTYAGVNKTGVGHYTARLRDELLRNAERFGISLKCYGPACSDLSQPTTFRQLAQEWPTSTQLAVPIALLRNKPTLVHSTSHIGPLFVPGKAIVTVHDLLFRRYPAEYNRYWLLITRALLPSVLRRASAVIADSHSTKDDLRRFYEVPKKKIVVIYPGVNKPSDRVGEGNRQHDQERYILLPGPWVKRKNLEVVMRAFNLLAEFVPDVGLIVTGESAPGMMSFTREGLLEHVAANYRSRVRFVGYVPREALQGLLNRASVLAYPSRWEGFGLPPLEAMSTGVPVVASRTPVLEEVTGGAAVLCDPDNADEWAQSIIRIVLDPAYAESLRQLGLRRSALFSWERCAEQTAALYHRVAGRGGAQMHSSTPRKCLPFGARNVSKPNVKTI